MHSDVNTLQLLLQVVCGYEVIVIDCEVCR